MKKEMDKNFNPAEAEDRIYKNWEDKGYFHAEADENERHKSFACKLIAELPETDYKREY